MVGEPALTPPSATAQENGPCTCLGWILELVMDLGVASCLLGGGADRGEAPFSDLTSSVADRKADPRNMSERAGPGCSGCGEPVPRA